MSRYQRVTLPLLLAALLAACAPGQPLAGQPDATAVVAEPTAVPSAAPTEAPPTALPTAAPTAPASTQAPTQAPTQPPTQAPTQAAATSAPTVAAPTVPAALPTVAAGSVPAQLLFLRDGDLIAHDPATAAERTIAEEVHDFAASADAATLAMVRGEGPGEIWLAARDGSGLRQVSANGRAERGLSWAPDGMSLVYTSAADGARPLDWASWSRSCAAAEVHVLDLTSGAERSLGAGCDPVFSPDGRRIAFASPPGGNNGIGGVDNAIRIVNRQGANGWSFASATGGAEDGLLVYAPVWSPDAGELAHQRFVGYRALVDINMVELGDSFNGEAEMLGSAAGWLLPPAFAPGGELMAVTAHNFSDARGLAGYDIWETRLLRLGVASSIAMPDGPTLVNATEFGRVPRSTAAAWSPDGAALALLMPQGWEPGADPNQPLFEHTDPGVIWRWSAAGEPEAAVVGGVDFASPLAWLPPPPDVIEDVGVRLAIPRGWGVREPEGPGQVTADGGGATMMVGGFNLPPDAEPAAFFPELVPTGAELSEPFTLPDGSLLRSFRGTDAAGGQVAGAVRVVPFGEGASVAAAYRIAAAQWPLERARAIALLCASGPTASQQ